MKLVVCSIRDRATDVYGQPFFQAARGAAIRGFTDAVNRKDDSNNLWLHPEDFDLFELGLFDDSTGLFETGVPRQISIGKDVAIR